jgi:enoyl-CoA hydratase/carnithine racemase
MTRLEEYRDRFPHVRLERQDGVLLATLHTGDGPLEWGPEPFAELPRALHAIGRDRENRVVVITGSGERFCAPPASGGSFFTSVPTGEDWDVNTQTDYQIIMSHLGIEVPVIAAVNGPALRRSELALLADIVIATPDASFEDGHFSRGLLPGDGLGQLFLALLGPNRGRYHLLTSSAISAEKALDIGLIGEIASRENLLPRALELAADLAARPPQLVRTTRAFLVSRLRQELTQSLPYGQYMEAFAALGSQAD